MPSIVRFHLRCEPPACRRNLSVRLGTMASTAPTGVSILPDFSNFQQSFLQTAILIFPYPPFYLRQFWRVRPRAARDRCL